MANSDATGTWNSGNFESTDPFFTTHSLDNADDWSEFIASSNGFNHTSSQPVVQSTLRSMNPIEFSFSNQGTNVIHRDSSASQWEKIKGAIPLSVFGLEEEEKEIGNGELNGFSAEANGGLKKDLQSEIDQCAINLRFVSYGPGEIHEASAVIPDIVNSNSLPESEVLTNNEEDNIRAKCNDFSKNQFNLNLLALKEKATGNDSLQDLDTLEYDDNSQNIAVDSDEDDWEFKNAEVKLDAGNSNVKSNDTVCQNEGQTFFGDFDSMWSSVTIDFSDSRSVVTNTNPNCFGGDDTAADKITSNGSHIWQFQALNPIGQAASNETLEDDLPRAASPSIVSTAISVSRTDTFVSTEVQLVNSNVTLHNMLAKAIGDEEEWSFQAAKLGDCFELPIWNAPHSNGSVVKEVNTAITSSVSDDLWAEESWDFRVSGVDNFSTSQRYETPANAKSASDCDGSQLQSSHSAGWSFSLDATKSAETGENICNSVPRDEEGAHSIVSPHDESLDFEENLWAFVGAQTLENSKALTTEAVENVSGMIPQGYQDNHSSSLANSKSLISEDNSWSFVSAEASGNKSEAPSTEIRGKKFSSTPRRNEEILSSFLPNDGSLVFKEKSWAFVGAEASENKGDAIGTPNKATALPLSLFGEEETEFDSPVFNKELSDNSKLQSGSRVYHTNASIEDIVSSLYNQMENNMSTKQSINDNENETDFPARVNILNQSSEVYDPEDDTWDFQDAHVAGGSNNFTALNPPMSSDDDEHDEYVDVFEQLRATLTLAVNYHLENHENERTESLDAILKEFNDQQVEIPDKFTLQEGIISNAQNLSEMFSTVASILDDPKFKLFESEYSLSTALYSNDKGFEWSSVLLKDVSKILNILKLATKENRQNFAGLWSKVLLSCLQELRHGAMIWKDLIAINAHHKLLHESRGKNFVMSLREIYRVVEILKVSCKIYKPWLCSLPLDSPEVLSSIDECTFQWSSSGLQEAYGILESGYSTSLESTAENVLQCDSPICQLSLLPESAVPDVRMVVWNGKSYFLNVANLWANIIHSQPPIQPAIHFPSTR